MKKKNINFKIDKKTKEILDARLIMALFKILYNQEKITKKEYKKLISKLYRRFRIEEIKD